MCFHCIDSSRKARFYSSSDVFSNKTLFSSVFAENAHFDVRRILFSAPNVRTKLPTALLRVPEGGAKCAMHRCVVACDDIATADARSVP